MQACSGLYRKGRVYADKLIGEVQHVSRVKYVISLEDEVMIF